MGRAYDGALMKRLLGYAKPYLKHSLLCVLLIVILVASELSCPLIVQMTIDDNAFGYVGLFNKTTVTRKGVSGISENCPFDFYAVSAATEME